MRKTLNLILLLVLILFSFSELNAQEVSIKDNKVQINNVPVLRFEKETLEQYSFYNLNDDEILLFRYNNNETPANNNDDFIVLNFLVNKRKVESKDIEKALAGMGWNSKKNITKIINWLLKEKVLTVEGEINPDKLDVFVEKYDSNITNRTMR
ncbi:hypothetical protein CMU84_17700 [Elizabethkingia anophelis]|nr:hypothetical protein [Elizabethkingia anophelis]MDV3636983.1 hypothetical protein [Elizabethkingia anophelis]MDV3710150.1 hypothetical protein [Elizabethkingia anophelis]MDV3733633.1 hypothetical protein [Elizabethkingia anophelis]